MINWKPVSNPPEHMRQVLAWIPNDDPLTRGEIVVTQCIKFRATKRRPRGEDNWFCSLHYPYPTPTMWAEINVPLSADDLADRDEAIAKRHREWLIERNRRQLYRRKKRAEMAA